MKCLGAETPRSGGGPNLHTTLQIQMGVRVRTDRRPLPAARAETEGPGWKWTGWGEAIYLGFAQVLLGPLEPQPEVRGVGPALEGTELDPEDALHGQPLAVHAGFGLVLHLEPFLDQRFAPRQEHGC